MFPKPQYAIIKSYYPLVISNITSFSHNQPIYLSCATTLLGKGLSHAFHGLTSNNSTHSTKTWVRALLLSSCQRLMAEKKSFYLDFIVIKELILSHHICTLMYIIPHHHKINHTSSSYRNLNNLSLNLRILTYKSLRILHQIIQIQQHFLKPTTTPLKKIRNSNNPDF